MSVKETVDTNGRQHLSWCVDSKCDDAVAERTHLWIAGWLGRHGNHVGFTVSTVKIDKSPDDPHGYYIDVIIYGGGPISDEHPLEGLSENIRIKYTLK